MIRKIGFGNFYSFKDYQEIVFTTNKKDSYDYHTSKDGKQITKVLGISGGNGSGKTNIIRVFGFLKHVLTNIDQSNTLKENLLYKTYIGNDGESKFYLEFETDGKEVFFYELILKNQKIASEKLEFRENKRGMRRKYLFERNGRKISLNPNYFKNSKVDYKNIQSNISLLPYLKFQEKYNNPIINDIYNFFFDIYINISESGDFYENEYKALKKYSEDRGIQEQIDSIMKNLDLDINAVNVLRDSNQEGTKYSVDMEHSSWKKEDFNIPFKYESLGTRKLLFLIIHILYSLKNDHVVVIDEFGSSIHPVAMNKLIQFFIDENEKGKSQLIFASHHFSYFNRFDMQQIYLAKKNIEGESSAYRLDQIEGIRHDENFLSKYLTGAYGAYPDITI